jgi:hypothetical protein
MMTVLYFNSRPLETLVTLKSSASNLLIEEFAGSLFDTLALTAFL